MFPCPLLPQYESVLKTVYLLRNSSGFDIQVLRFYSFVFLIEPRNFNLRF